MAEDPIWLAERSLWLGGRMAWATWMAPDCLAVLAPGKVLGAEAILDSMGSVPRWQHIEITERCVTGGGDTMALAYHATARRDRDTVKAICSSTWRREAGLWKLIHHHQSPLG